SSLQKTLTTQVRSVRPKNPQAIVSARHSRPGGRSSGLRPTLPPPRRHSRAGNEGTPMNTNAMDKREVLIRELLLRDLRKTAGSSHRRQIKPSIARADRAQNLPLSRAQQRLWFLAQLDPAASVAYHMPATLRLQGSLDRTALQAALDRIVARHEILRTSFVKTPEGEPVQVIAADARGFALGWRDLRNLTDTERQSVIDHLSTEEFQRPFDIESGPLIRGQLLQLADDDHI